MRGRQGPPHKTGEGMQQSVSVLARGTGSSTNALFRPLLHGVPAMVFGLAWGHHDHTP